MSIPAMLITADGSHTLLDETTGETYHSTHGALTESMHVFIRSGLMQCLETKQKLSVLEMGFGAGLNAFLCFLHSQNRAEIYYHSLEAWPIAPEMAVKLNYPEVTAYPIYRHEFEQMHFCPWNTAFTIGNHFTLYKQHTDLLHFEGTEPGFDLIFFDAFSHKAQAGLWSQQVFEQMHAILYDGGILLTYSASGPVKTALRKAGFSLERLAGPPGKRHMLRATKTV